MNVHADAFKTSRLAPEIAVDAMRFVAQIGSRSAKTPLRAMNYSHDTEMAGGLDP